MIKFMLLLVLLGAYSGCGNSDKKNISTFTLEGSDN